ncbi:MAG: sulfatase-like hydrolase/transferase [Sphingomonas sp.]
MLTALEESGQADNTIVVFLADHGEYAAAHGMMLEKWYTAYQEALHVPVVVRFPRGRPDRDGPATAAPDPVQYDGVTSHIDILPTVLGLAGVTRDQRRQIGAKLAETRPVPPLPGVDLSTIIRHARSGDPAILPIVEPDGQEREGVLFITDDDITAPLAPSRTSQEKHSYEEFAVYLDVVESVREGRHGKGPVALAPGPVKQPSHVRAVRTRDYKLARYFDPSGREAQQWEMYDVAHDPIEAVNLVEVRASPPRAREDLPNRGEVQLVADRMASLLERLERRDL